MTVLIRTSLLIIAFAGCASTFDVSHQCGNRVSSSVAAFFSSGNDTAHIRVIVTVSDTAGLRREFPSMQIVNSRIALGHLMKSEIVALCRHKNIVYIETPKKSFPNN
ncbi:MAG: hypothetical protein WCT99_12570 [Bacteroidota bacterium]|jgi:hypothetical protein